MLFFSVTALRQLDLTLPTPAENLACDEALLESCEAAEAAHPILRFWEPTQTFVVLGYANRIEQEVDLDAARAADVPVLRRCSGGGTVVQSPGCLNYSLIMRIENSLEGITETNCHVMKRNAAALKGLVGSEIAVRGHTDLTLGDRKVSGNAQRRKRRWLLFHGTFLCGADITLMARLLKHPPREPDYRQGRSHGDFVTSLKIPPSSIKQALCAGWNASEKFDGVPNDLISRLVVEKYATEAWNLKW